MSYKYGNVDKPREITLSAEIKQILKFVLLEDTYQFIPTVNDVSDDGRFSGRSTIKACRRLL